MSDSNSQSNPQTTSNVSNYDQRAGISGDNNYTLAAGATDRSLNLPGSVVGGGGPTGGQSVNNNAGPVFAPQMIFGSPISNRNMRKIPSEADFEAGNTPPDSAYDNPLIPTTEPGPSVGEPVGNNTNFGGAADNGGVVTGGPVTGPVASGADSTAYQANGGFINTGYNSGPVNTAPNAGTLLQVNGDNKAPVISAPVGGPVISTGGGDLSAPITTVSGGTSAPVTVAGGDVKAPVVNVQTGSGGTSVPISSGGDTSIGGPVIAGNNGPVTVTTDTPEIVTAALSANKDAVAAAIGQAGSALQSSNDFAQKALAAVTAAKQDPNLTVTKDTLNTVLWLGLGLGAVALFTNRKAA